VSDPNITRAAKAKSHNRGRPLGSRDKFPRKPRGAIRSGLEERARMLETELGQAYATIAGLEQQLKIGKPFDGDSKALLKAVYRGEYIASPQQIYAARAVLDREWPPVKSPEELDLRRAELEQERQALHRHHRDGDARLDALIAQYDEFVLDREKELAGLERAGLVAPAAVPLIRAWWAKEPPLLPPPAQEPMPEPDSAIETAKITQFSPPEEPPLTPDHVLDKNKVDAIIEPTPIASIIWAPKPFWVGQAQSGRKYDADSASVIEVDDRDDRKDLLAMGCRERK
jgi:hypothetical protein